MVHPENKILELQRNLIYKKYVEKASNNIFHITSIEPSVGRIFIYLSPYLDKSGNQTKCDYELFEKLYSEIE
jgi:hypothetical protein